RRARRAGLGNVTRDAGAADGAARRYARLLRVFPRDFARRFGADMADVFRDQCAAAHASGGPRAVARLWRRTWPRTLGAALLEWRDALLVPSYPAPHPGDPMLATLGRDLRLAVRSLRRAPLVTAVAVLCIALGTGAVTTLVSAFDAFVLRPMPGTGRAGELVRVERTHPGADGFVSLPASYLDALRARARTVSGVVAWTKGTFAVRRGDAMALPVTGSYVTGDFFPVLGVRPRVGRFFQADEDGRETAAPVVVVSERFWRTQLGADSTAVGGDLLVNGRRLTLVGVAPAEFQGPNAPVQTDAWVPLGARRLLMPTAASLADRDVTTLQLAARLRPGVTTEAATRELERLTADHVASGGDPEWLRKYTDVRLTTLRALPADARRTMAGFLGLLTGAAALVLLIASVNVAALLSARAVARRREMAVRAAIGAGRGRLVAQLLTEILVLFGAGAAGGLAIAFAAARRLEALPIPGELPMRLQLAPDLRVFGFSLLLCVAMGALAGLVPARRALALGVATRLRDGAGGSARRARVGDALVAGQIALSLVLLVGAGLFVRAVRRGAEIPRGFDAAGVTTVLVDAGAWGLDGARARTLTVAIRERIAAIPGVTLVSAANGLPLTFRSSGDAVQPAGPGTADVPVSLLTIAPGYHAALRIPLLAGRDFRAADDTGAARVAVVNQTLVRTLWPALRAPGEALGRTFGFRGTRVTVVGVTRDAKHASLAAPTPPLVYLPLAQHWESRQWLLVRTDRDPAALTPRILAAVRAVDPDVPRPAVETLEGAMAIGLLPQRAAALVTVTLGGVGLLLAVVGLYGTIAYAASRRTREVGIRLALGARRGDVVRLLLGEGGRLTAAGLALGLLLAAGAARLLGSLLFGLSPLDAVTYVGTTALLAGVALLASWIPARRAAAANPTAVLRQE
ncbi:ADOP family duplicated permease, partial [Roseisolibacter sp. H3M3-2]|uniref:ADOP family duplicated permease n=1 Tax=Roseisolibacter sp. H3M3-2 TaxID=3031323 RepID=UPI0023D98E5B